MPPASAPAEITAATSSPAPQAEPKADAVPASFAADVNLNVRKTRIFHLELGASSLGFAFRDGILNATLGGMELYDGHASGKLVLEFWITPFDYDEAELARELGPLS